MAVIYCPVCGEYKKGNIKCPKCGYDEAGDYLAYPTLSPVKAFTKSVNTERWEYNNRQNYEKKKLENYTSFMHEEKEQKNHYVNKNQTLEDFTYIDRSIDSNPQRIITDVNNNLRYGNNNSQYGNNDKQYTKNDSQYRNTDSQVGNNTSYVNPKSKSKLWVVICIAVGLLVGMMSFIMTTNVISKKEKASNTNLVATNEIHNGIYHDNIENKATEKATEKVEDNIASDNDREKTNDVDYNDEKTGGHDNVAVAEPVVQDAENIAETENIIVDIDYVGAYELSKDLSNQNNNKDVSSVLGSDGAKMYNYMFIKEDGSFRMLLGALTNRKSSYSIIGNKGSLKGSKDSYAGNWEIPVEVKEIKGKTVAVTTVDNYQFYWEKVSDSTKEAQYLIPNVNKRYVSEVELAPLSAKECMFARNEIAARHGRLFNDSEIQSYFNNCSWYKGTISPSDFQNSVFNNYENKNSEIIINYENRMGYR